MKGQGEKSVQSKHLDDDDDDDDDDDEKTLQKGYLVHIQILR